MSQMSPLRTVLEPLIRRLMHLYWRFSRGLTLGVRGVVLNQAGEVFLIQHSYVAGWHLPGGGVETGETSVEALTRELKEEGNISVTGTPVLHGLFFNARASRRDHVAVYVVRDFRQDSAPVPDHEIIAHGFFQTQALPVDTTAGTRARIAEVLGQAPIAAQW